MLPISLHPCFFAIYYEHSCAHHSLPPSGCGAINGVSIAYLMHFCTHFKQKPLAQFEVFQRFARQIMQIPSEPNPSMKVFPTT
jgi:hypothetical protein